MTSLLSASNRDHRRPSSANRGAIPERLSKLTVNPWALSCSRFLLTALLIRSDCLNFV